jgi:hypothetical protein
MIHMVRQVEQSLTSDDHAGYDQREKGDGDARESGDAA